MELCVVNCSLWRGEGHTVYGNRNVLHRKISVEVATATPSPFAWSGSAFLSRLLGEILGKLSVVVDIHRLRPNLSALPQTA